MTVLDRLHALVAALPDGATVTLPVGVVRQWLTEGGNGTITPPDGAVTWRERVWTCPDDTRLGVLELCEATGRPKSWVYRAVARTGAHRLPHAHLGGELVFKAGAVREWLAGEEVQD